MRESQPMSPQDYVQQKAAASGSSFYYAFLFLPPERRAAITAFYAFCREVDDVVDEIKDPSVAATKLAWWQKEVQQAYAGQPSHPVMHALMPLAPTLSTLSLCNCSLTDISFTALFPALLGLRRLQSLGLDFNKLTNVSLPLLVELCMERKSYISLRGNSISEADLEAASADLDISSVCLLEENLVLR